MATAKKPQAIKNGNAKKTATATVPGTRMGVAYASPLLAAQKNKARAYMQADSDFLKKAKAGKARSK